MGKVSLKTLEVTRSVLLSKLSGLVMMHWRYCSCERQSNAYVPTFSLPMLTSHGLSPVKWSEFSPSQLGTTATITASMSYSSLLSQSNHQYVLLEAVI